MLSAVCSVLFSKPEDLAVTDAAACGLFTPARSHLWGQLAGLRSAGRRHERRSSASLWSDTLSPCAPCSSALASTPWRRRSRPTALTRRGRGLHARATRRRRQTIIGSRGCLTPWMGACSLFWPRWPSRRTAARLVAGAVEAAMLDRALPLAPSGCSSSRLCCPPALLCLENRGVSKAMERCEGDNHITHACADIR